ncbi:myosin-3-like [Stegodyphus dumicola]|uniref:myosin-3-like n=1 Tax=Stegodyphus dumicola TaxID=202533 RepID=UPI0015A7E712|nr:myosin-3-like [Stegodyphus dumicola]
MLRERLSKDSNSISIHKSFDNISFNGCNSFYSEALIHDYEKTQNFHVSNVVNDAFSNSKNISTNINSEETKHSSEDQISNYLVDMHSMKSLSSLAENDAKDASSFICVCAKQKTTTFIPTDLPKLNISCQTEIYEDVEDGHSVNFEVAVFVNEMTELAAHLSEIVEKITHFRFSENIDEIYEEKDSTLNSVRKKIHVMKEQLTILDSDIRLKAESFDYLNNTFKPKMTEVLSMQTQLVETQTVLKEKECLLLDMQNDLYSLRQKMSLLKSMYKHTLSPNPDSEAESVHEEKECISDKTSLSRIHDIATMERILLELESYFIRNNATVSELSSKLIEAEAEVSILQAMTSEFQNVEILKFNRYTQTSENYQIENHAELNRFKSKAETFENEVICLQTEIKILNDAKLALEQELEDAKLLYSSQVNSLQSEYEIHKNIWHSKTAEFVKSLEDEHRQEIADIENKCSNYISEKTKELKKQVILLESEKEELKKMLNNLKTVFEDQVSMLKIDKEKNMVDFQARLSNEITEKENLKHQISEKENKLNLLRIKCQNADDLNAQLTQKLNQDTNEIQKLKEILSNMMKSHSDEPRSLLHTQTKENKTSACENCNILSQQTPTSESDLNKKNAKINLLQTDNRNLMRELEILKKEVTAKTALLRICKCNNIPKIKGSEPSRMESSSKIHISGKISDSNSERRKIRQQSSELSNSASMLDTKAVLNQDFVQKAIADAREEERALLTGGGSGEANILKAYWLERELHKKDKKIKELEEKLSRPYYNPRRTSPDKFKKTKNPFGLSEDAENVTACPEFIYFKDAIPAAPRKGAIPVPPQKILCEKNGQFNIKSPKFKIEIPEMQSTSETKGKLTKGKKSENLISDEPGCKQQ